MVILAAGATLKTKLIPPTKRSGVVERRILTARIQNALDHRLILLRAPAGYGKTSVLGQVYASMAQQGLRVGWIGLDESDKDVGHFLSYLVEVGRRAGIPFGNALSTLLGSGASIPDETLRTLVLNDLANLQEDVYVFLDDYHLLADDEIRDLVNAILRAPLSNLRLIIASRTENQLPLTRLRVLGQLFEIDAGDLMFSDAEVAEFVENVCGLPLNGAQVTRLREETEGWAASLQMAGIAMRGLSDIDKFLDRFTGEHKSIGDFLGDEVLRGQPAGVQEFLIATSILKRFSAALCDAVTGQNNGRSMLDEVERRNLFVFSLDLEHHWYRYHHLFADFLLRRLSERRPELVALYHLRACEWLAEHRLVLEAIEHAFHANDTDRAGELLDGIASDLFAAGQTATLSSLTSRLPHELLDRLPRLQLECAWENVLHWDFERTSASLDQVQASLEERRASGASDGCPREMHFLQAKLTHRRMMLSLLSDDLPRTAELARELLRDMPTSDVFMAGSTSSAMMAAERELYRCEGTATLARMLNDRFVACGAMYGVVFHQCITGATFSMRGDLDQASDALGRSLEVALELHGEHSDLYNMPALMLAELHYERGDLRKAEEFLAQRKLSTGLGFVDNLVAGYLTRSRLFVHQGRSADALAIIEEGSWVANRYGFRRLYVHLLNEQARQLIAGGHIRDAARLLRESAYPDLLGTELPQVPVDGVTTVHESLAHLHCRIWMDDGRARDAASLLRHWYSYTRGRHCYRSTIRSGILLARAHFRAGDARAAQRVMVDCLKLGEPGRFIRSFIDEGLDVIELLYQLAETAETDREVSREYLQLLLGAAGDSGNSRMAAWPAPATSGAVGVTCDALSEREAQVLELGARGLQNQDIARALCLAESTVKWYWQRVFEKFDVRRRPDAIRRGRQLQLIP